MTPRTVPMPILMMVAVVDREIQHLGAVGQIDFVQDLITELDFKLRGLRDDLELQPKAPNCPVCGVAPGGKHV
jgi:hypothetical protein